MLSHNIGHRYLHAADLISENGRAALIIHACNQFLLLPKHAQPEAATLDPKELMHKVTGYDLSDLVVGMDYSADNLSWP